MDRELNFNCLGSGTGSTKYSGLSVKLKSFGTCVASGEILCLGCKGR